MRNIKLILEYDGTNYHGWQKQPNLPTIQATVENALSQLCKTDINLIGAGRTDTGVHAEGQVANFHTLSEIPVIAFKKGLNTLLPYDIVISSAIEVKTDFHARFSAKSRRYRYRILNREHPSALYRNTCYLYPRTIDVDLVGVMCKSILGKWDFTTFQKTGSDRMNPICELFDACCWKTNEYVYIELEADSFLRGMVRLIVGTILKCIKDQTRSYEDICKRFHDIIIRRERSLAGPSVPAHGLSLIHVKYDD